MEEKITILEGCFESSRFNATNLQLLYTQMVVWRINSQDESRSLSSIHVSLSSIHTFLNKNLN